jgi:thiosulfate/3-mercaptopyruvate sulfurtransferase
MSSTPSLVSTDWLTENLNIANVKIIDATWFLPNSGRDAKAEFKENHIPGAHFFDVDEIADLDNPLPHMMPSNEKMSSRIRSMGINNSDHIVVYDNSNLSTAARAWFMFKNFDHENVSILNGGYMKWTKEGKAVDNDIVTSMASHYSANKDETSIRNIDEVLCNIDSQKEQVVDARSAGRFNGTAPEPRPESRPGHIPGSYNVPFNVLINEDSTYKTPDQLKEQFDKAGVDLNKPIITSCGSGVTACVLLFTLDQIGHTQNALYDGSWSEWGCRTDTPIEK